MSPPAVLFTIAGLHPESGGPSRSLVELCGALAQAGADVEIVSLHYGAALDMPLRMPQSVRVTFVDCSSALARRAQWTPQFRGRLAERCCVAGARLIHDTGLWLLTNHAAARVSRKYGLGRIVSPRGMLTPWALRHKSWKKQLAWWLYQRRDLESAQVLHATSEAELATFRHAGLTQPVAVVPNGVDLPPEPANRCAPADGRRRTVLFLGRIHPVKGLLDWVEAWACVRPTGWRVVVAGPNEGGHRAEVEAAVRARGLESDFEFVGPVSPAARWAIYRDADVFVLPSRSENFGNAVAEALACEVPVITTHATPWAELGSHRCGWWVEANAEALAQALRRATACTDAERAEMGARGRELVRTRYAWPAVAERMLGVYRWMLGESPRPEWVRIAESAQRG